VSSIPIYSFRLHYLEVILQEAVALFPGFEQVVGMFYDEDHSTIRTLGKTSDNRAFEPSVESTQHLLSFRNQKARSTWLMNQEALPTLPKAQLAIGSELYNHTLLIRFPDAPDSKSDILLISFKNKSSIFILSANEHQLTVPLKEAIAVLLVKALDFIRLQNQNNKTLYHTLSGLRSLSETNHIHAYEKGYRKIIMDLIDSRTKEIAGSLIPDVSWSVEAVEWTMRQHLSIAELNTLVDHTLLWMLNQHVDFQKPLHIELKDLVRLSPKKEPLKATIQGRAARTLQLLDRYEKAARELRKRKEPITGAKLGLACEPKVSAPAISDALRKHRKRILKLLNEYPNRWTVLRQDFKPIRNLLYQQEVSRLRVS
jgi:hypothetical protein